jgi:hypothetical protein
MKRATAAVAAALFIATVCLLPGCSGSGSPRVRYSVGMGVGYGGYYGRAPYGYYRPPVIIGAPGPGIDRPVATPLPEPDIDFGMPDAGFNDFGGFDF